ncbi:MAG: hypothetical protein IT221_11245, partial [Fluviicola sp.]|nr:hypothetical protein [Fluviicola sp.]
MSALKSLLIQVSLFFWFYTSVHGQLENNIWYFGTNAGLNFSTSPPTAILGSLSALEGTASICNSSGSLLFYTNGVTVWNANHLVMQNGSGILGGASSTQPALIVPIPQSCQKYYLFTTEDHMGSKTFRYSIVDMCLNGGLGGIDPAHKNVPIAINISEKLTAVMHSNGTDIWVITHVLSSNVFKVFLVDAAGIHPPVINAVGTTYTNNNFIGPVKASPSGTKIAAATTFPNHSCELFNFNKSTGVMTLSQDLQPFIANGVYGLEFSPNENFLYIATTWGTNYLYQYNLTTNAVTQLSSIAGNYNFGALQLGLDNRIYLARNNESFLGVINAPNTNGLGCNYIDNGIYLAPGSMSNSGMPNFSAYSFFQQPNNDIIADSIVNICTTGSYPVNVSLDCNASILWNTGSTSPTQNFTTPGVYTAIIQNSCNTIYDTLAIISSSSTVISLPNDTTVCGNLVTNPLTITANYTGFGSTTPTITWNTGVTAPEISITDPGTYIASITTSCGVIADTIVISEVNLPIISGPTNLVLCENTSTVLSCSVQNASNVYWSNGELGNSITVNSEGNYTIYAENACEIDSIQIVVDELQKPVLNPISSIDTC